MPQNCLQQWHILRGCQVFCVSFEKIFWGGKPPHSYAEILSGVNSLKRSLKVLPSHRSILVLLVKQQSVAHMLRWAGQPLHPDQLRPASWNDGLYFPIFHEGTFSESSILVFANPFLDFFIHIQLISDKCPVALQIPAHLTTHSAKSWSVFPDVTERVSASADQ